MKGEDRLQRDPTLREAYLKYALHEIPRILGSVDRCPMRKTYGCFDREYWHYRTSGFPSEMYQEAVLPLALVATIQMPGNIWYDEPLLRELATAGIRFSARTSHADGSCDDYYPYERALGAAVFSLQAATRAYQLLELDEPDLVDWFVKRADWIARNDESGHLTNHHALAALGLARVAKITGETCFQKAAEDRIARVLDWQHDEGWFDEYGGADPGYQTVTIDCLAQYRRIIYQDTETHNTDTPLDQPLRQAVRFVRHFLHPDDSFGGEYGSRGTRHFYPHGMELLAGDDRAAAELADGFLRSLTQGTAAHFSDDRMYVHRLASMIEAWQDWSFDCPAGTSTENPSEVGTRFFSAAGLFVERSPQSHTVISTARGGVFKLFSAGPLHQDAGLVLETTDGQISVSQQQSHDRPVKLEETVSPQNWTLKVEGPLHRVQFETATPLKQIQLFSFMLLIGRWCRDLVRRLLQRRLITGQRPSGIHLERIFERSEKSFTVTDRITLTDPKLTVRRMYYAVDFEAKYTAASGVFQRDAMQGWRDLGEYLDDLNETRSVEVQRKFFL